MLRGFFLTAACALASCAAPAVNETAPTVDESPEVIRGSQDGSVQLTLAGHDGVGAGTMQIEMSRPVVVSVSGIRIKNKPLNREWIQQVMDAMSEHSGNGTIDLNEEEARAIVHAIPLPKDAELKIEFTPIS